MQELKITQEMDFYNAILTLTDEDCTTENLLLEIEDGSYTNSIVIEKHHAKQIVLFLQNYFNL